MSKKAVILAGGKGTRLRPYTSVLPKPLMPIGDYPILEVIIKQLACHGFNDVTLAVNHQADLIRSYFGDGSKLGVSVTYSLETIPLSTMGPLKIIEDLPEHFLVMNGDILTDLNFSEFLKIHERSGAIFTIATMQRESKIDYGVLEVSDGKLVGFAEKPVNYYDVSMGIYAASRRVLEYIPHDTAFGFDQLMYELLSLNMQVETHRHGGTWLDIGRPDDYMKAIDDFEKDRSLYLYE